MVAAHTEDQLAALIAEYTDDPLGYVRDVFPWGEGELAGEVGPDVWQEKFLADLGEEVRKRNFNGFEPVDPIQMAVSSGHGIGKGVTMAWVACWIMDTRPNSQGTVTANTYPQLQSKTWPAICRWRSLSATREWWEITGESIYHRQSKDEFGVPQWFLKCQSSAEENFEAFAGQHAARSTSYYLFDEASAIGPLIWRKAHGGCTDGEPMFFAFGNSTRNTGEFYEVNFGKQRHRWNHRCIDSRTSRFTNKAEIQRLIEDHGIDSDTVRVDVLGLHPMQDESQFISLKKVEGAQERTVAVMDDEPLIAGMDFSGGGSAMNVIRFRRGRDSRPGPKIPAPVRLSSGRANPTTQEGRQFLVARISQLLNETHPDRKISAFFADSAFGAPVCDRLRVLGHENVFEINFGGPSPDEHYANMRAYMWGKCREWLDIGAIDQKDEKLAIDLCSPGWHFNKKNQYVLESKEEMAADKNNPRPSPDDGDALVLTFAMPVAPPSGDPFGHDESAGHRRANPFGGGRR